MLIRRREMCFSRDLIKYHFCHFHLPILNLSSLHRSRSHTRLSIAVSFGWSSKSSWKIGSEHQPKKRGDQKSKVAAMRGWGHACTHRQTLASFPTNLHTCMYVYITYTLKQSARCKTELKGLNINTTSTCRMIFSRKPSLNCFSD